MIARMGGVGLTATDRLAIHLTGGIPYEQCLIATLVLALVATPGLAQTPQNSPGG